MSILFFSFSFWQAQEKEALERATEALAAERENVEQLRANAAALSATNVRTFSSFLFLFFLFLLCVLFYSSYSTSYGTS